MADKCCADCFYCGNKVSSNNYKYRCNKTKRVVEIDDFCSSFLDKNNSSVHACWECTYFGTYMFGSIFEKENYCEKKKKVVDEDGLACSNFCKY